MALCKGASKRVIKDMKDSVYTYEPRFVKDPCGYIVNVKHAILIHAGNPETNKRTSKTYNFEADECDLVQFEAQLREVLSRAETFYMEVGWTP